MVIKKYLNYSLVYAIAAMIGGVFYREITKWNGYTGITMLGKVHTHLFLLGMMVFLIVALFAGIGHILTGIGIILLLLSLKKANKR